MVLRGMHVLSMLSMLSPLAEAALSAMEEMRKDPKWVFSLAKAADAETQQGWCKGHRGPAQSLRASLKALAEAQVLPAATISQIECCFSSRKVYPGRRHHCSCFMLAHLLNLSPTCSLTHSAHACLLLLLPTVSKNLSTVEV